MYKENQELLEIINRAIKKARVILAGEKWLLIYQNLLM